MRMINRTLIFFVMGVLFFGSLPAHAQTSNAQSNKKAYADALAQAANGTLDMFYQLYPARYKLMGQDVSRKDTQEATGNALLAAIPDLQLVPDIIIAQNNLVAAAVIYSGTFSKPFSFALLGPKPFPPTNNPVTWMEINLLRFNADGQIVEQWVGSNPNIMLAEFGIIPPQPANPNVPPIKYLPDPVGFKALKPGEQAATFTSGMEKRNLTYFSKSEVGEAAKNNPDLITNPYNSR